MSLEADAMHRLRSALNGLVLQLEVAAAARDRGDADRLSRALDAARAAAAAVSERVEDLEPTGASAPVAPVPGAAGDAS